MLFWLQNLFIIDYVINSAAISFSMYEIKEFVKKIILYFVLKPSFDIFMVKKVKYSSWFPNIHK